MSKRFIALKEEIEACTLCAANLPLGPRPVFQATPQAQVLVVGQAPGTAVHASGIPFDDPSGDRLREWMGVSKEVFYNPKKIALVPMGFCYPGKGSGGDLPPRSECAPAWREELLGHLNRVKLTIVLGRYAIDWHLPEHKGKSLTAIVEAFAPTAKTNVVALPHPSPRNTMWLRRNPKVEEVIVPFLKKQVASILKLK